MIRTVELDDEAIRRFGSRPCSIEGPLVTGQISRRLLTLHGVLTLVEQHHPELFEVAGVSESRRLLGDAQRAQRAATNDLLRTPSLGSWVIQCARHHAIGFAAALATDIGHVGAVTAVACLRAELPFEVTARTREDGTLMLPTLGRMAVASGPEWIRVRGDGSGMIDVLAPGRAPMPIRPDAPSAEAWEPLRRLRSEAQGLTLELVLDDIDPYRGHDFPAVTDRLDPAAVAHWQHMLDEAWRLLARQPEQAKALRAGLLSLVPLQVDERAPVVSATARDAVGAAGVTLPRTPDALAEALVHEYQHSALWALLDVVDLVADDPTPRFYAPWRSDPRPCRGLLHGAFAFHGLLRYWAERAASDAGPAGRSADFELALWRTGVRTVVAQLTESALLTPEGVTLLGGMRAALDEASDRPVPDAIRQIAEGLALDLWTTWRLRNRRPAPGEITDCCAAWRTGAPRPPVGAWTLADDGRRFAGTPRLGLVRRKLAEPEGFRAAVAATLANGGVEAADMLYAERDWDAAAGLYAAAVRGATDALEPWSGLLLAWRHADRPYAGALLAHPEHARAAYVCVANCTGQAPDVDRFAEWFGAGYESDQMGDGSKSTAIRSPRAAASTSG